MFKSKTFLLISSVAFVVAILGVSIWIIKNHTATADIKDFLPATKDSVPPEGNKIILERGGCYGTCPIYKLTINADGSVIFEGKKFVKEIGIVKSTISPEKVAQLVAEFENAGYLSLNDKYVDESDGCPTFSTDSPSANTSITINGKTKSVLHNYGCQEKDKGYKVYPQALFNLENRIDGIVGTAQWIK